MRIYLIVLLCLVLSCKKDNNNYTGRFTIINAVPNSTAFTLAVADVKIDSNVLYGVPAFNVKSIAATTSIKWKQNAAASYDSTLKADIPNGSDFTLLFYDSLKRYKGYLVRDYWQQPGSKSQGYIRFFPMVIGGNELYITNDTVRVLIGPRSFGDFTTSLGAFKPIDSLTTKLRLFNKNVQLDSLPATHIAPGKSYTLYAIGVLGSTGDKRPRLIFHAHE